MEKKESRHTGGGNHLVCLLKLDQLPDDVLYLIFSYLDKTSLARLSCVCQTLHNLADQDFVWLRFAKKAQLIQVKPNGNVNPSSNSSHRQRFSRCPNLKLKERCRISNNWKNGDFRNMVVTKHSTRQLPCLEYDEGKLWLSVGREIKCYRSKRGGVPKEDRKCCLGSGQSDISKFRVKDGVIVSSCRDGSVCGWHIDTGHCWFYCDRLHSEEAQCVDFHHDVIVSGSRDKSVKVVLVDPEYGERESHMVKCEDRVWSLSVSPEASSFAVGTSGCLGQSALSLFNLKTCSKIVDFPTGPRRGAGVLDIQYEDSNTILTCGYDTFLRLWDVRTGSCVSQWEEPFDSALYCVKTDGGNMMVAGTSRHGMTRLWDKRTSEPIQKYYCGLRSSPVYSLDFDQSRLFVALDLTLHMLDFAVYV